MPGIFQNAFQDSVQAIGSNAVALGSNGFVGRAQISIFNPGGGTGPGTLYVGGPSVASNTGLAVASNTSQTFNTPMGGSIYGVSDTTGAKANIRIIEY